jgi:hypothetical protein
MRLAAETNELPPDAARLTANPVEVFALASRSLTSASVPAGSRRTIDAASGQPVHCGLKCLKIRYLKPGQADSQPHAADLFN